MERLVKDIKNKKELSSLEDSFVKGIVEQYIRLNPLKIKEGLTEKQVAKSKAYKDAIKGVRKVLRGVYGAFKEKNFDKRWRLLGEVKGLDDINGHSKILALHKSTKERLPFYEEIYSEIFKATGKPKVILDLGCGLNPFSLPFMKLKDVFYFASELTKEDSDFIQAYFDRIKIKGKAFPLDLTKIGLLPEADVCFLFKMLDTLETLKGNVSRDIIEKVNAKFVVVSFPTMTLGAKAKISPKRLVWFERVISKFEYSSFEVENEKFYIIRKI